MQAFGEENFYTDCKMPPLFGMDNFNRSVECSYNNISAQNKYVSLDNLDFYNKMIHDENIPAERIKLADGRTLQEIFDRLKDKDGNYSCELRTVYKRLRRRDLKTAGARA